MPTKYGANSRFTHDPIVLVSDPSNPTVLVETIGAWRKPSWLITRPPSNNVKTFVVTNDLAGRPDNISNQIYGTSELEWVLISFNDITDVFGWPKAGTTIEYPTESVVIPEL